MPTQINPFHARLERGRRRTLAEIEAATTGHNSFSALRRESVRALPTVAKVSTWLSHQRMHLGGVQFVDLDQHTLAQPSHHTPLLVNNDGQESTSQRWQTHISPSRPAARPSHPVPHTPPASMNFSPNGLKRKGTYSDDSDDDVIIVEPPPSVLSYAPRPVAFVDLTKSDRPQRQTSFLGNRDDDVIIIDPPAAEIRRQLRPLVLGTPRNRGSQPENQAEAQQGIRLEGRPEFRLEVQPEVRLEAQPEVRREAQPKVRPEVQSEAQPKTRRRNRGGKRRKQTRRGVESAVERRAQQSSRSAADENIIPEANTTEVAIVLESIEATTHFFTLAVEIRDKIYRQLLVSPMPIRVHGLWTEVARRSTRRGARSDDVDNTIDTRILSVCRRTAVEATRILYSENAFFYLLRDPEVVENASGLRRGQRGPGRGRWEQESRSIINLAKYGHLIRHMIIELESNRTKPEYEKLMSAALETLVPAGVGSPLLPSPPRPPCAPIHLHTLTITISPLMQTHRGERAPASGSPNVTAHDGRFLTTVGFFSRGAPVLKALQRLNVDFLRINVHVNSDIKDGVVDSEDEEDSEGNDGDPETASVRAQRPRRRHLETTIDLRCLPRHMEGLSRNGMMGHLWANDALMQEKRRAQGAEAEKTLAHLRRHVEDACLRPEMALRGGVWEDHGAAERRRREQQAKEDARFDADAYDEDDDEDDSDDQRVVRGMDSLIISIARVGEELRAYRP